MARDDRDREVESAAPQRNFPLSMEERVRGAAGPPAWSVRRRRIEDLEERLVTGLFAVWADAVAAHPGDRWAAVDELTVAARALDLAPLNTLIDRHNRYYPCESNLPMDPRTGAYLERGRPWRPTPPMTLEALVELVLSRASARGTRAVAR
jgi:hypothetical protein